MSQMESVHLSIVVPLFNEQDNVEILVTTLIKELQAIGRTFEIILVDDGSSDKTWERIDAQKAHVVGIKLSKNFGHQHALLAGLTVSRGKAIISMDGDMQHPPTFLRHLVDKHDDGYLIVNTKRNDIQVASAFKRTTSKLFYKVFSFLTDVSMEQGSSDFRLIDRVVLDELLQLKDRDLFLRGAVEWLGFKSITLEYEAAERFSGESKYPLKKMLKFAKGSIVSFSTKPLVIGIWMGLITSLLSFIELIYILIQVIKGETVPGWASTLGIISLLFGVLFIILGIIGMYLARIHTALQNRPRFIIEKSSYSQNDQS
jgi:dolichol-phosphate mannosyltransferase